MDRHDQKKVPNSYQLSSNTANMYKCIYNIVYTHTQTLILLVIYPFYPMEKSMSFINPKTTLFVSQLLGALPSCRTKRRSQGRKLGQIDVGLESLTAWSEHAELLQLSFEKAVNYYMKIIMNLHCEYWKVCFFSGIQIWPVCGVAHHAYQYSATYHSRLLPIGPMLGQEVT